MDFEEDRPVLVSEVIRAGLGDAATDVCVLMGANVADEVARDEVSSLGNECLRGRGQEGDRIVPPLTRTPAGRR